MVKIVVVGAGVTGLTTAYLLSEKGHDVTIISKKFHFDGYSDPAYTSNFAGANWASFNKTGDSQLSYYDKVTYPKLMSLARYEPRSGIHLQTNCVKITKKYFEENKSQFADEESYFPWYKDFVEDFKVLSKRDLESKYDEGKSTEEYAFGYSYLGVVISTNTYLGYLLSKCVENGCKYKRKELSHIMDAESLHSSGSPANLIINCTGILARFLGGVEDGNMFPIKGQTILVENNFPYKLSVRYSPEPYQGEGFYLMPRVEGGCVIGGCMLANDWSAEPDLSMSERIAKKAVKFAPLLINPKYNSNPTTLKIVRHQVGFRPGRKGDVRVERDAQLKKVIHNYGAGGTGFQSSFGTCGEVVKIIDKITDSVKL